MGSFALKRLIALILPEGVLLAVVVLLHRAGAPHDSLTAITPHYVYVVLAMTTLLAVRFHRGRVLMATLILGLSNLALSTFVADAGATGALDRVGLNTLAVLVPLDLAILGLVPEHGTRTRAGLVGLALVAAQAVLVYAFAVGRPDSPALILDQPLIDAGWTIASSLPQLALAAFVIAALALIARLLWRPDAIGRGLLWSVVAVFMALHEGTMHGEHSVYFATAGVLLIVAVIESSHSLAYRDALTGLPTRRALDEMLARLRSRPFTAAMVDVDHFKRFNDKHGHDAGDQVLRMIATQLARVTGGGRAFRYGGEEFAIIFPGKAKPECTAHLETLRKRIAGTGFIVRGPDRPRRKPRRARRVRRDRTKGLTVTVSIGAAERTDATQTPDDVIRAADQALYRAKKAGRNRVRV